MSKDKKREPAREGNQEWRELEERLPIPPAAIVDRNVQITLTCPQCSTPITIVQPVHRDPVIDASTDLNDGLPENDTSTLTVMPVNFDNVTAADLWESPDGKESLWSEDRNQFKCPDADCNYVGRFTMLTILKLYLKALATNQQSSGLPK